MKNFLLITSILLLSGLLGFSLSLYLHRDNFINTVPTPTIETFHYPATFVKQLAGDPQAGQKIFQEFCASCHAKEPVIDVNAPRIGDKKAWQPFQKMEPAALLKITIMGAGAMPARGGCFECSDAQLEETIRYMLHATP